ncbi:MULTISPECIES: cation diffusion facilitator family transporter [unclassified Shewanella]|uniref:cation efflux pump FieF n=1 Tax=unclassified Shewanella TaxID=196818 RepID=UPI000C837765|nr:MULTISPECIES: cation diffusion facilitator family transporter [unclassified Shewanella]MDO6618445.1 cation diffusion facilitator family transporter [Shewanella sp. 6_MG-2023]MDO6640262.1 cation diffusion facilitator family transporter [Shewanella sp. 5_MG-2023]MDO6679660.1 cation diffusion facilitator family transporter [Shewanella sp. 4_MG-2023]MDO6774427.1 cation diffusion facilitator family transporter [Shewanella sp. 3_MG-2023]PMG28896.1 divalent metal cation transporter FieF [Shewanell
MTAESEYDFWVKLASRAAVATALILIVIKLLAWLYSGSASMLASLTDSFADALASIVNFIAIRYAILPADDDHRYGHGKAEPLASLAQSAFILGSAFLLMFYGGERLINPVEVAHAGLGVIVSIIALVMTFALVILQKKALAKTNSTIVEADSLHYKSDLFLNGAVLLALVLAQYGWWWADGLFAVLIALYIGHQAFDLAYRSVQSLLDRELDEETRAQIVAIATADPRVNGIHDLRTRQAGKTTFIQFHIELNGQLLLLEAHEITDGTEDRLRAEFEDAEVIIHQDPI